MKPDRHGVTGCAQDDAQPDAALDLLILDNDALAARHLLIWRQNAQDPTTV